MDGGVPARHEPGPVVRGPPNIPSPGASGQSGSMKTVDHRADLQPAPTGPSSSADDATFGRALRERRRRRKLTVSHLASLSGMSASYLSRIEHDQLPPPSAKIMHRLAVALNTEVGALQAAAGQIPDRIIAVIRNRPAVLTLLSLVARQPDNELFDLCEELLKRSSYPN